MNAFGTNSTKRKNIKYPLFITYLMVWNVNRKYESKYAEKTKCMLLVRTLMNKGSEKQNT